jgi:hypothetical protein
MTTVVVAAVAIFTLVALCVWLQRLIDGGHK